MLNQYRSTEARRSLEQLARRKVDPQGYSKMTEIAVRMYVEHSLAHGAILDLGSAVLHSVLTGEFPPLRYEPRVYWKIPEYTELFYCGPLSQMSSVSALVRLDAIEPTGWSLGDSDVIWNAPESGCARFPALRWLHIEAHES